MNISRNVIWRIGLVALIGFMMVLAGHEAEADHFKLLQQDSSVRARKPSPGFNAVAWPWWWNNTPTYYWHESGVPEADTATLNWQNAWNNLTFQEVTSPLSADLTFVNGLCQGGKLACIEVWSGFLVTDPQAFYW